MGNFKSSIKEKQIYDYEYFDERKDKKYGEIKLFKKKDLFFIKININNFLTNRPIHKNYIKLFETNENISFLEFNNNDLNLIFQKRKIQKIKYKEKELISYFNQILSLLKFMDENKKCFLELINFENIEFNNHGLLIVNDLIRFSKYFTISRNYKDYEFHLENDAKNWGVILYKLILFKKNVEMEINNIELNWKNRNDYSNELKNSILKLIKKENIRKIQYIEN